jgi:hypothetical protein
MSLRELAARVTGLGAPPRAAPWERWSAHDSRSTRAIGHGAWSRFLGRYVVSDPRGALVRYAAVPPADRAALAGYIGTLADIPVSSLARGEQLAYWVNLYNALTVKVVLDHYPVASIRDIKPGGPLARGPWDRPFLSIEGVYVTLGDIEHRILRPLWREPRVHFVLNCASLGCPDLGRTAFPAGDAESALDRATRLFVNEPKGAATRDGTLVLSSIFVWYADDFGPAGPLPFIRRYAGAPLAEVLGRDPPVDHAYDWRLNDAQTSEMSR